MYKPSATFCPAGMDACALWRMFIPHLNLATSRFIFAANALPLDHITRSDVAVVQRMMMQPNIDGLQMLRAHGMRIIYDLDDNVWNLPAYNPAKAAFEKYSAGLLNCIEWADVMTVSTESLKKVATKEISHLRNAQTKQPIPIVVIENYCDLKLFRPHTVPRKRDTVRRGWGGSDTHAGDLWKVWNMLPDIIYEFENVELEVVGMRAPDQLIGHPRVKERPWCHVSEFMSRLPTWDWDIFLAPLEDNKFNKSKSAIKVLEAASMGKPCLASHVENYVTCYSKVPELKWQLCSLDFQWQAKLRELIKNAALREELGQAMLFNVTQNYNIEKETWRWNEVTELALSR